MRTDVHPTSASDPIIAKRENSRPLNDRSRRNGIVFDDITNWAQNVSPTTPIQTEEPSIVKLSDMDFSKPQPRWLTSAVLHHESPSYADEPPILKSSCRIVNEQRENLVDFLALSQYQALQQATELSISAIPPRAGYLQNTLFLHITHSLSTILDRAERGLQDAWGTRWIRLPEHFIDAMIYVVSALESLSISLTAEPIPPADLDEIKQKFSEIVSLVVHTGSVIDGIDIRNLITDSVRHDVTIRLGRTLHRLIAAAEHMQTGVESTLQVIAEQLPKNLPTMLLSWRLHVYKALITFSIRSACDRIVNESTVLPSTLDNLDRSIPIARQLQKQLDRIAAEEEGPVLASRKHDLTNFDLQRAMIQAFLDGISSPTPIATITFLDLAKTLARQLDQCHVQAECMYRIASLAMTTTHYSGTSPRELLISARQLNSSMTFQRKVDELFRILARRTISSIFDMATLVHQAEDPQEFVDGVKIFVSTLLDRYPVAGIDGDTVLDGDVVKGLLKVVRVFHPDKNPSVDEEEKWVCEEVTKVFAHFLLRLMVDLE